MIDLVNGLILFLCGIAVGAIIVWKRKRIHIIILVIGSVLGAAIHSLWRHALERNEQDDWNKIIRHTQKINDKEVTTGFTIYIPYETGETPEEEEQPKRID